MREKEKKLQWGPPDHRNSERPCGLAGRDQRPAV